MLEYKFAAILGTNSTDIRRAADIQAAYELYKKSTFEGRGIALCIYDTVSTKNQIYRIFSRDKGNLLAQIARIEDSKLPSNIKDNFNWLKHSVSEDNKIEAAERERAKEEAKKLKYFKCEEHPEIISEVVSNVPIVPIIKKDTELRVSQDGTKIFAKSPFLEDAGYSFLLNKDGTFKDYAAGISGNVVDYVSSRENISREDAVKYLMKNNSEKFSESTMNLVFAVENRLDKVNEETCKFYSEMLTEDQKCKQYFEKRGFSNNVISAYGLGTSGKGFEQVLRKHLRENGFTDEEMLLAGVIVRSEKNNRHYDFFHDRAIIPIKNADGKVVGFGGRTLIDDSVKYLNTKTTPCFQKYDILFNFEKAKNSKQKNIIFVEGFMDCISAYQSGLDNVVAGCGTAFTETYADLIKNSKKGVVLCYDNDEAGRIANESATKILKNKGVTVTSINMSKLKDFISDENHPCKDFNDLLVVKGPNGIPEFLVSQNADVVAYNKTIKITNKEQANYLRNYLETQGILYKAVRSKDKEEYFFKIDSRDLHKIEDVLKFDNNICEKKTNLNDNSDKYIFIVPTEKADELRTLLNKNSIKNESVVSKTHTKKTVFKISQADRHKLDTIKEQMSNVSTSYLVIATPK